MGLSDKTVRSYLGILTCAFMVRQIQPWFENTTKRQVRAPKIYLRDSGLLHSLLNIPDKHTLLGHPKVGASWEGYAIEQALSVLRPNEAYFWATHGAAELDLLFFANGKRYGIEVKFSEVPEVTRSMHIAQQDLGLEHLWVIYPGEQGYPVQEQMTVWPLKKLAICNCRSGKYRDIESGERLFSDDQFCPNECHRTHKCFVTVKGNGLFTLSG